MEESLSGKILSKIGVAIFVIALVDLAYLNWWILQNQNLKIKGQNEETLTIENGTASSPSPSPESSPLILVPSQKTEEGSQVKTVETKTVVEKQTQTIVQTAQKEIFIPLGSGSTTNNSFADLSGTDVNVDTSKYSSIESVVFEASIWVEGGNGRATARITNLTDKSPYVESEISNNTGTATVKTSGKIPLASGSKTYRVQAKTDITNFPARVDNARIKITLK